MYIFALNYVFIGTWIGLFVVIFEIIRDSLYIKLSNDMKIFILTVPVYIIIGIVCYDGLLSLFSVLAAINDDYSLVYMGNKLVFLVIITYILWLVHDIFCNNYINALAKIMVIISNVVILIKGNRENAIMHRS